jgi:hypothetical protein
LRTRAGDIDPGRTEAKRLRMRAARDELDERHEPGHRSRRRGPYAYTIMAIQTRPLAHR